MLIRPESFWADRNIAMHIGQRVTGVDAEARTLGTATGETCSYGNLIWATGGAPRKLSCDGHHYSGIHAIRTRADVELLKTELGDAQRIVIVGGGYIGLEAAAVLSKLGKHVTVLEALDRVLARVAGPVLSAFYEAEHRAHGVTIRTNETVIGITGESRFGVAGEGRFGVAGEAGRATGVRLIDDEIIPADIVIVGIGIIAAVDPLLTAGAAGNFGVDIDDHCRTSLPHIFAIGDCAVHANSFAGGTRMRLESVQNANDMATTVARLLTGNPRPYHAVPWFWSNQYDLRLQTVGLSTGYDATVLRGDIAARSFSVIYLKAGAVIALDCVNAVRAYVQGKALVEAGAIIDPASLADAEIPLKHWHVAA